MEQTVLIPIEKIVDNPYQHRDQEDPDSVKEIAISIAQIGMQQYPAVRAINNHYELVFGHTRTAAYRLLATQGVPTADIKADKQFAQIPVYVRVLTDRQMFELAIVENLKRRDPKPTEKAKSIAKYLDEFKATSKEAGELFGMNDATARGMVRLLDLVPEAQTALDEGRISQGTARTILSMQKIASRDAIVETISRIEKNESNAAPDQVIEDSIERLKGVVELWDDNRRDGKPRSAWSNGWLLDMKNFPNNLLPELTKEEAACDAKTREHLINPPACTACRFYTKVRGSHYCGVKVCHTRKTTAWYANLLQQASSQLRISLYEQKDGRYVVLDSLDHRSLFNSKHKDLRLLPASKHFGSYYQFFDGIENKVGLVVATGEAILKMNSRGNKVIGGKMTDKEKADRRMMKIFRTRRLDLMWEYAAAAKSMFDAVPLSVLDNINRWKNILMDDNIPEKYKHGNADGDYSRRALVWRLIMHDCSHYKRQGMTTILTAMQKRTGVKPPKALVKQAEQWDAEINAAAKSVAHSVAVETKKGK
jgi:ParB/RepB/Spo0J family partition protein